MQVSWNPEPDPRPQLLAANEFTLMDGNERPVESTYLFAWISLGSTRFSAGVDTRRPWMLEFAVLMTNDL